MAENKISIEEYKNVVGNFYEPTVDVEWNGLMLHIKKLLSVEEMMRFVEGVTSLCFERDTDEYLPEINDLVVRCFILEYYTNFTLPESLEERYFIVYSSDIVPFVTQYVERQHFEAMMDAIERKIRHRAQGNIEAINKQMNEIMAGFDALEKSLSGMFDGVDGETISKIASTIVDGGFDERKLVEAFSEKLSPSGKIVQL